jgi:chromosome partitioning protein
VFADEFHKRVLVIDLDGLTNPTIALIHERRWEELNERVTQSRLSARTLCVHPKNADSTLIPRFGATGRISVVCVGVDLLPASLDLIAVQDRLAAVSGEFDDTSTEILKRAVDPILENYDYVVVDCPANLGTITLSG